MKTQKVSFQNNQGQSLSARIEFPENEIKAYALFAHCFTCNKNLNAIRNISRAMNACGIAVMSFDFTGLGDSEGDFGSTNFSSNVSDLIAAAQHLEREFKAPNILIGHSLGGAAVIFAAQKLDCVTAVATIGAPSSPQHVSHLFSHGLSQIMEEGEALLNIGGRPFKIQKQFLEDINKKNMEDVLKNFKRPILILHSPQDSTVGIENAAEIYQAAWHPKSFISLDHADHLLSKKADSEFAGTMIASWSERYIVN